MPLSEQTRADAARLVRRYPVARSALLPLLHLVQSEQNHVTEEGIAFCAELLGLTKAEVGAVATFYTMFKRQPVGDYLLSVCKTTTCKFAGADEIYAGYVEALGGAHHDPETKVTVEHAECLGICDAAPVVQINYEMYGPVTREEADGLLAACRKGEPPVSPWSGEAPPTFAEFERHISGVDDAWADELIRAAEQQIAYANPPAYRSGETDIPVTHAGGDPRGVGGAAFRAAGGAAVAAGELPVAAQPDSVEQEMVDALTEGGETARDVPPAVVELPDQPERGDVPSDASAEGQASGAIETTGTAQGVQQSPPDTAEVETEASGDHTTRDPAPGAPDAEARIQDDERDDDAPGQPDEEA